MQVRAGWAPVVQAERLLPLLLPLLLLPLLLLPLFMNFPGLLASCGAARH